MTPVETIVILIASVGVTFVFSLCLTAWMLKLKIVDVPNARSSHVDPTPRTGGLAMALSFLIVWIVVYLTGVGSASMGYMTSTEFAAFALIAVAVVVLSLIDDIRGLSPLAKLAVQFAAALCFVLTVSDLKTLVLPGGDVIEFGNTGAVFALLWIVFFMNAFNFMDGINGIAAGTAIAACLFLSLAAIIKGDLFSFFTGLFLAAAALGFLRFNFPRGRIFMGDNGSQFLGFMLAGLALWQADDPSHGTAVYVMPLVCTPFIFDVIFTLIVRALRGENVLHAHREHLYQIAGKLDWTQPQVAAAYFALAMLGGFVGLFLIKANFTFAVAVVSAFVLLFLLMARAIYRTGIKRGVVAPIRLGGGRN